MDLPITVCVENFALHINPESRCERGVLELEACDVESLVLTCPLHLPFMSSYAVKEPTVPVPFV